MTYDTLVFIGRFQPFHKGHQAVVEAALEKAKELVIVIGSAYAPRNIRNPFTFREREAMIREIWPQKRFSNIHIVGVPDYPYNDHKWIADIQRKVEGAVATGHDLFFYNDPSEARIGLIGHSKDETSYYLNIFPKWGSVEVPNVGGLDSTTVRTWMLGDNVGYEPPEVEVFLDERVRRYLSDLLADGPNDYAEFWTNLRHEYRMITEYKKMWEVAPYPPTFVTVDAVVVCSGHVLLVKRKEQPGAGLLALPGGFLSQKEKLLDGAIRELKEETKIKVPVPVLKGSIKDEKTFDNPNRSTRGRTITTAFYIDLGYEDRLPKVTGADDAEKAMWIPFNEIKRDHLFEDHFGIIDYFVNIG